MALVIPDIIALHVQSARNSSKTVENQGKLPQKWREDDVKVAQKLQEIKLKVLFI
jgi:hypothetical protein